MMEAWLQRLFATDLKVLSLTVCGGAALATAGIATWYLMDRENPVSVVIALGVLIAIAAVTRYLSVRVRAHGDQSNTPRFIVTHVIVLAAVGGIGVGAVALAVVFGNLILSFALVGLLALLSIVMLRVAYRSKDG